MLHKYVQHGTHVLFASGIAVFCAVWMLLDLGIPAHAQQGAADSSSPSVQWQAGPTTADLGRIAEIEVPKGYLFADAEDTRTLMEAMQNPTSGKELGFLAPSSLKWFIVFEFSDIGYVLDDEKDDLDAEAILKSIQAGTERANELRRQKGWATIQVLDWEQPPHYDPDTQNLAWAARAESEGNPIINYNTRLLGRKGVMRVNLVTDPSQLATTLPVFKGLLQEYDFKPGQRYAEYRAGDKVAKYGLTALITGGAVAVALKTGLLVKLWKVMVKLALPVLVAIGALFKKLFGGKKASTGERVRV